MNVAHVCPILLGQMYNECPFVENLVVVDVLNVSALEGVGAGGTAENNKDAAPDFARAELVPEIVRRANDEVVDGVVVQVGEADRVPKVGVPSPGIDGGDRLFWQ